MLLLQLFKAHQIKGKPRSYTPFDSNIRADHTLLCLLKGNLPFMLRQGTRHVNRSRDCRERAPLVQRTKAKQMIVD
jgi:hypothetical protein